MSDDYREFDEPRRTTGLSHGTPNTLTRHGIVLVKRPLR
jgi:hypothetical protein